MWNTETADPQLGRRVAAALGVTGSLPAGATVAFAEAPPSALAVLERQQERLAAAGSRRGGGGGSPGSGRVGAVGSGQVPRGDGPVAMLLAALAAAVVGLSGYLMCSGSGDGGSAGGSAACVGVASPRELSAAVVAPSYQYQQAGGAGAGGTMLENDI